MILPSNTSTGRAADVDAAASGKAVCRGGEFTEDGVKVDMQLKAAKTSASDRRIQFGLRRAKTRDTQFQACDVIRSGMRLSFLNGANQFTSSAL
ncbi:hypothetical protein [Novipirellula sp.]|uniref:hypothetical protein n=1 Tax=Novipirellula sp. TaxID=2795430 RepID=UPI003565B4C2